MKTPLREVSEKILVFTKNWIGDVMFETPAIHEIKRNFPRSHLAVAVPERCREIVLRNPYVDEVITFDERISHRGAARRFRFATELRTKGFTHVFLFHRSFTRALICFLAKIPNRYGYSTKGRGFLLTHFSKSPKSRMHDIDYFLSLLSATGLQVSGEGFCEFYFTKDDRTQASRLLSEYDIVTHNVIAISPGANTLPKRWRPEYFAQLADLLHGRFHSRCIICGSKQDEELARLIQDNARISSPISLCGKTNLGVLGALFSMCRLVISSDSGPSHIAAGVGVNVLALFGPTDPLLTGPRGRGRCVVLVERPLSCPPAPCEQPKCGKNICMDNISPERVFEAIEREHLLL